MPHEEDTMNIGMLWYDDNPKTALIKKIERAAGYYEEKYGKSPTLCLVHPTMLTNPGQVAIGKDDSRLEVRAAPFVQPNHFWIGLNTEEGK
jgi:hypothetical protein